MSRKVYIDVTVRLVINMEEGINVSDVIQEMDYSFDSQTDNVDVIETEIKDFEVADSK